MSENTVTGRDLGGGGSSWGGVLSNFLYSDTWHPSDVQMAHLGHLGGLGGARQDHCASPICAHLGTVSPSPGCEPWWKRGDLTLTKHLPWARFRALRRSLFLSRAVRWLLSLLSQRSEIPEGWEPARLPAELRLPGRGNRPQTPDAESCPLEGGACWSSCRGTPQGCERDDSASRNAQAHSGLDRVPPSALLLPGFVCFHVCDLEEVVAGCLRRLLPGWDTAHRPAPYRQRSAGCGRERVAG